MPDVAGLFDSFLEAAVSLAVLFVIVAWVSSKIVELGQLTFNVHGKMLRDELERCFGEDNKSDPNKGRFTRYFYWHPMIVPLTQPSALVSSWRRASGWFRRRGEDAPADAESRFPPGRLPGHIAPESFAAVVMNPFPWPTTEEPLRRLLKANLADAPEPGVDPISDEDLDSAITRLIRRGQSLTAGQTWRALLAQLGLDLPLNDDFLDSRVDIHSGPGGGDPAERYVEMCRANELVPHPLETRIITLLRDADDDFDEFRAGLRRWYAEAMARVTGRFKRTALVWVFFVALIICTLFNLNAINLFSALMASPDLRAAGVAASQVVGTKPGGIEALGQKVEFTESYRCVDGAKDPKPPAAGLPTLDTDCQTKLLKALWRDSRRLNRVETFLPGQAATRVEQVKAIHDLCEEEAGLCNTPFKAKLDGCDAAEPVAAPEPANPSQPAKPSDPAKPNVAAKPSDRCNEAWDSIWGASGFFWHPGAARQLALSLDESPPGPETAKLRPLLYTVRMQAAAETGAMKKFIQNLPDIGPIWKDKKFWKADKPDEVSLAAALRIMFGVLLSAILAALGAPFWYDVLGKLSRRGTSGARGEKT